MASSRRLALAAECFRCSVSLRLRSRWRRGSDHAAWRLRASEICDLQWHQVELDQGRLHVRRAKQGTPSVHPIRGDEIRALRRLRRENPTKAYVFISEHGGPMSPMGFHHLMAKLGEAPKLPFSGPPPMFRPTLAFKP